MSATTRSAGLRGYASRAAQRLPFLVDLYRLVRNPRWEMAVRNDLRNTRKQAQFLRGLPPAGADAPVVLLGLYRDDIYETKLGLVLASSLRLVGYRIVVLVPSRRAWRAARYAAAYGITDVMDLEGVDLTESDVRVHDEHCRQLHPAGETFADVAGWEYEGHQIGVHLLSTLIRLTFDGDPDLSDPEVVEMAERIRDELVANYLRLGHVLEDVAPDVVLVEESNYSLNGPLVDLAVAADIDVVRTVAIWREDALMSRRITAANRRADAKAVDRLTVAELGSSGLTEAETDELWDDFARRYGGTWDLGAVFQPGTVAHSAGEIVDELGLDPDRATAVVFAHVLWDASLAYGDDLFRNHADWLVATVGAAVENEAMNWVVKAHPSNVYRSAHGDVAGESREVTLLRNAFPELPPHVKIAPPETPISTRSLYEFADVGITVRGTPGLEMACIGKPVLTAGTGHYSGLGFTTDSASAAEYLERCAALPSIEPPDPGAVEAARRYAHLLFLRRPWVTQSFEMTYGLDQAGWQPLYRNIELRARSVEDIEAACDLIPWAEWVVDSSDPDYLSSAALAAS